MRRPLIVGNWKMNGTVTSTRSLVSAVGIGIGEKQIAAEVAVCPPFVHLSEAIRSKDELQHSSQSLVELAIGVQNVSEHTNGAYTGEVSAEMLTEFGCSYAIVGHSERRHQMNETDELVARKARILQEHEITPIVCVGETLEERESEMTREVIERQLNANIEGERAINLYNMVIAYEPVWAIGTGNVATVEQVQQVHGWIRERLNAENPQAAEFCRILYGGSVNGANAAEILSLPDVDGCLVGGASLRADEFLTIFKATEKRAG